MAEQIKKSEFMILRVRLECYIKRTDGTENSDVLDGEKYLKVYPGTKVAELMNEIRPFVRDIVKAGKAHKPKVIVQPAKPKLIM